jgi:hypothetical protein
MGEKMPHCPHCARNQFEFEEVEIEGKKVAFVQCSGCKAPIGVLDPVSAGLTDVIRVLVSRLQKLNELLERIEQASAN